MMSTHDPPFVMHTDLGLLGEEALEGGELAARDI